MLELHEENDGLMYGSCRCGDDITTPRPITIGSTLTSTCFSPAGAECDWYRDCLEERHPCGNADTGYAISYAEKFCNLYNQRLSSFSEDGQLWLNVPRKCLQVDLVPLLRPCENPTCDDIKQRAFDSHSDCYLSPSNGPSICHLGGRDWAQVFWTIKSAFVSEFVESMMGMVEVLGHCIKKTVSLYVDYASAAVSLVIDLPEDLRRETRQVGNPSNDDRATVIADAIAATQKWDSDDLGWYAYGVSSNSTHLLMMLLLGDRRGLRESEPGTNASLPFGQNDSLTDLAEAVASGRLGLLSIRTGYAYTRELKVCADIECNEIYLRASSNATVGWSTTVALDDALTTPDTSLAQKYLSNDIFVEAVAAFALVFQRYA